MKNTFLIVLAFLALSFQSCTFIWIKMYGVKNTKELSDEKIEQLATRYGIAPEDSYALDSSFSQLIMSLDSTGNAQYKNHYQPLQALYYDSTGKLISFHINCYAGGFPNLDWERDSIMNSFPPKSRVPLDSLLPMNKQFDYIRLLSKSEPIHKIDSEYVVIVFGNRFMSRQSKRLINIIKRNVNLNVGSSVKMMYVNNDNFFLTWL